MEDFTSKIVLLKLYSSSGKEFTGVENQVAKVKTLAYSRGSRIELLDAGNRMLER